MFKIKHVKTLELEIEEASNLVAQVLKEEFDFICKEINIVRNYILKGDQISSIMMEDYQRNCEIRNAMKTLLEYYLTHDEYVEFLELQRTYGNV